MKKMVMILLMALTMVSAVCASGINDKKYLAYKEQVLSEIQEELTNTGYPDFIYQDERIRRVESLWGYPSSNPNKVRKCQEDLRQALLEYETAINEYNDKYLVIAEERGKAKMQESIEFAIKYSEASDKYFPVEFKDLTTEQKNKVLHDITGGRVLHKPEWDLMPMQVNLQIGASIEKAIKSNDISDIREAINWCIAGEAVWHLGYINRWTDDYEYNYMTRDIYNKRANFLIGLERK